MIAFVFIALPYLLSPYVYITHNPVDDALVAFLGVSNVKPVLYLSTIIGGIIGLMFRSSIHGLYLSVLRERVIEIGIAQRFLTVLSPVLIFYWYAIMQLLWDFVIPYPSTGNLMGMFFALPIMFFGIVISLVNIIEHYRANYQAKQNGFVIQFTMIRSDFSSWRIELVPLISNRQSTDQSIDIS